jgi:hypothetical protein
MRHCEEYRNREPHSTPVSTISVDEKGWLEIGERSSCFLEDMEHNNPNG